jgi:hypothetical protein
MYVAYFVFVYLAVELRGQVFCTGQFSWAVFLQEVENLGVFA